MDKLETKTEDVVANVEPTKNEETLTKADFEKMMVEFKDTLGKMVLDQTLTVVKNFTMGNKTEPVVETPKAVDNKISDF